MHINDLIKKMGTTRLIVLSFVLVISVGTLLLCLPFAQVNRNIGFIDNLFTATTATCVTGLTTMVYADVYTVFGQLVILALIQIGGLGLMSIIAMLVSFAHHKFGYREKEMLKDAVNKIDMHNLMSFLKHIFIYTFIFEFIGFILLSFVYVPEFGLGKGLYHSVFLAISAFCNAGIDLLGSTSLINYATNPIVNFTIMGLIITGGLGFAVWFDIFENLVKIHNKEIPAKKFFNHLLFHSKVVIVSTISLITLGTILIFTIEIFNPNTLGGMNFANSIMAALFNSVTLRTAGFSTIDYSAVHIATLLIMCAFMFIGGSPGGTAGGIKTTTFFTLIYYINSQITGKTNNIIYKKQIKNDFVLRSLVIFIVSLSLVLFGIVLLFIFEPDMNPMYLIFEAFSAFGTVGLSAGITSSLSEIGKIIIIVLMLIGRVGATAMVLSFVRNSKDKKALIEFPRADYLVG